MRLPGVAPAAGVPPPPAPPRTTGRGQALGGPAAAPNPFGTAETNRPEGGGPAAGPIRKYPMPRVDDDAAADAPEPFVKGRRPGGTCVACGGSGINSKGGACYPCQTTGRAREKPPKEDHK